MKYFKMNLQLFAEDNVFDVNALDSLLGGNTPNTEPEPAPEKPKDETTPEETDTDNPGGGPNLESPEGQDVNNEDKPEGEGTQQQKPGNHNAVMARMRVENTRNQRVITELAKALGIQEQDPEKIGDALIQMAQEKLAKKANIPVELYQELHSTKDELAQIKFQQNQITARSKFMELKETYGLSDDELMKFAGALDAEGINAVTNPQVDLEYEYYKRNREALEQKRIQKAVEEALRKSTAADTNSTKPDNVQGKPGDDTPDKINNVSALNSLLDGSK